jgi:hypothetical protein
LMKSACVHIHCSRFPESHSQPQNSTWASFLSPLPAKPKGTISLPSVCPSVCPSARPSVCYSAFSFLDFSLQWMKIFNWNLIDDYISMSYWPSLNFVTLV